MLRIEGMEMKSIILLVQKLTHSLMGEKKKKVNDRGLMSAKMEI